MIFIEGLTVGAVIDQSCPSKERKLRRVLLPLGEGGPKGRMRAKFRPHPPLSRHPLPEGEGSRQNRFPILRNLTTRIGLNGTDSLDRPYSRKRDQALLIPGPAA